MLTSDQIRHSPALSSRVKRYHTWPTIQTQTTGEHSAAVLRLYISCFGTPTGAVAEYIIHHDTPELVTGDPPYPIKKNNPVLAEEYRKMDDEVMISIKGSPNIGITKYELSRVKVCDLLEMYEFGIVDELMGNRFAGPIVDDTYSDIMQRIVKLNSEDHDSVLRVITHQIGELRKEITT